MISNFVKTIVDDVLLPKHATKPVGLRMVVEPFLGCVHGYFMNFEYAHPEITEKHGALPEVIQIMEKEPKGYYHPPYDPVNVIGLWYNDENFQLALKNYIIRYGDGAVRKEGAENQTQFLNNLVFDHLMTLIRGYDGTPPLLAIAKDTTGSEISHLLHQFSQQKLGK